ncbi:hypothetical protein BVC93_11410 [Mycobacterium sp. MS1601]|uniref:hypothetical protein n=1 Tax=Mycobacterium sp. MS1601 TaxID=1936029 RepID=UPI0009793454|nr:hypothetical protein [Mycobacterium sp. MS1601]AQA02940.1 hypothetical protein BVC93_11410 [Mycobacterium sp. MS1601]
MTLHVDHDALEKIARGLFDVGASLDETGASAPASVDGGVGTPAILESLARMVDNAGQLVVAVKAAGDAVGTANTNYRNLDDPAADSQSATAWTE